MLARAGERPVFVVHSRADKRVRVHHSQQLEEVAKAHGLNATFWYIEEADHVRAPALYPEEFAAQLTGFFDKAFAAAPP
jgi:dipeptidyl aminopeptidase/acylaminoacyl peptidase